MDMWNAYNAQFAKPAFGTERIELNTKTRAYSSLSAVSSKGKELNAGIATLEKYDGEGNRYVLCRNVIFDLLLTLYDVDSAQAVIVRANRSLGRKDIGRIRHLASKFTNVEMRAIGMQNGEAEMHMDVRRVHDAIRGSFVEADLFGGEIRHICFDMKNGVTYDLLPEDRHYRPGELNNTYKKEDTRLASSELKFA